MQILNNDWLTNDPIDFEYKKYLVLAYNQKLDKICNQQKLYPTFTDIIDKLKIVNEFLQNTKYLEQSKLEIANIDWANQSIKYKSIIDDSLINQVKEIAVFSKEILIELYDKYRKLLDEVDESIVISGCRVEIFNLYDGYIILKFDGKEKILEYEVVRVLYPHPHYILKTRKADLKEYYTTRYTKNIFDIIFKEHFPMKESIIPVYRRKFLESLFGFI